MKWFYCVIFFVFLVFAVSMQGCRCNRSLARTSDVGTSLWEGLSSRRFDGLLDALAERQTIRIEYYEPRNPHEGLATADSSSLPPYAITGDSGMNGTVGTIKSVEITSERSQSSAAVSAADSSAFRQETTSETLQEDKASETRQDNGTWIGIAVVCAVAALVYYVLKEVLS